MQRKRITLKNIADKAGVHKSTVSLALKNHFSLPPSTRARIQRIAKELNYCPDPALSALMAYNKTVLPVEYCSTIGYVTKWRARNFWKPGEYYDQFFQGAASRAQQLGYKLENVWLGEPGMTSSRFSEILYHRNIRGLIVAPLPTPLGHMRLKWDNFASVAFGYSLTWPHLHRVSNHQYRSMKLAIRQLRKMGYRRIGLVMQSVADERVDHNWMAGFYVGQQTLRAPDRIPPLISKHIEKHFKAWILKYKPEVIIGYKTGVLELIQKLGFRVPEDIGLALTDCMDRSGEYAGIYQKWDVIGSIAIDMLAGLLHRNEYGIPKDPVFSLVEGEWIDGKTLRMK